MRILIAGGSGFIGRPLHRCLAESGHHVQRLIRPPRSPREHEFVWEPSEGRIDPAALHDVDAVINLAGEPIAAARWNEAVKDRIARSRLQSTELLVSTIASVQPSPRVFVSASAVGFYGDRGDEVLTEESPPGCGFLADVCRQWEAAAMSAAASACRVSVLRIGMVLGADGGALARMLPVFRLGLGGVLGDGCQYMSWITIDDTVAAIIKVLEDDRLAGPINVTAPHPVTNRDFTRALGRAVRRPTLFRVPGVVLSAVLGEMADALLLRGARAVPKRLIDTGFVFRDDRIDAALLRLLSPR